MSSTQTLTFEPLQRGIYLTSTQTAIFTDLHISNETTESDIDTIFDAIRTTLPSSTETLIFNGDTFNEYPFNNYVFQKLEQFLEKSIVESIYLIEGNHERIVGGIEYTGSANIHIKESYSLFIDGAQVCIYHGDIKPPEEADIYVIGHVHPAVKNSSSFQPTLLQGQSQTHQSTVYILPSFTASLNKFHDSQTTNSPLIDQLASFTVEKTFSQFQ